MCKEKRRKINNNYLKAIVFYYIDILFATIQNILITVWSVMLEVYFRGDAHGQE